MLRYAAIVLAILVSGISAEDQPSVIPVSHSDVTLVRSKKSGPWSQPETWDSGQIPGPGNAVQIREGHEVVYDIESDQAIRSLYISGKLSFAPDRNTRLDVGLIKIQPGNDTTEHGFNCSAKPPESDPNIPKPALEVGTPEHPIEAAHTAKIRLVFFDGMDPESCPAMVCCNGRMDFHGTEMNRTWLKLGADAKKDSAEVTLSESVSGWRKGDQVIITGGVRQNKIRKTFVFPPGGVRDRTQTEERTIVAIDGSKLTLDKALEYDHVGSGDFRTEVANLSRNVVVESADPAKQRGHTMYHRNSAGSISYAEFRHLGKEGVLGRYSLHFHLCGDTMRGSSVIGASIWDSGNRWITIHGTNFLIVRDCVGYNSIGHGFFLEDGTEQFNVLDRNLAVQARHGKILPQQVLPFDHNDGAGFWWGNCMNTFTRNVAAECDEYGYRFDMTKTAQFDPEMITQQLDGTAKKVDVRTLTYVRFEDNEAHTMRRHSFNLGGFGSDAKFDAAKDGVAGVGPDGKHPMILKNCRVWDAHWALHTLSPYVVVDNLTVSNAEYGIWRSPTEHHVYNKINLVDVKETNFTGGNGPRDAGLPKEVDPATLGLTDDMPPQTVITSIQPAAKGKVKIHGTTADNGEVKRVTVNGQEAKAVRPNFAEWEIVCDDPRAGDGKVTALAEDSAGNVEKLAHVIALPKK
jgi:hypothetical protein